MGLFNFGKKKDDAKEQACACNAPVEETKEGICCIKVLGAGCKSCHEQFENVKEAIANLGLSVEVEYITDMEKIMNYGVRSMPAIVINEKVVSRGKVLKVTDVEKLIHSLGF